MHMKAHLLPAVTLLLAVTSRALAASVFTTRPDDSGAVYVTAQEFNARGDGRSDDSGGVQAALDKAAATTNGNGGVVFVPSGRYRLTRTLYVWRGVRVIGFGATRPVFVLADNTPGFQKGIGLMVMFTHAARPGAPPPAGNRRVPFPPPGTVPPNPDIPDAGPATFYPAMSNIDFEIGAGNPSPFWQFTLIDSVFEGQREAAIREHMAGLTLIRDAFRDLPVAIDIDPHYSDQLWVKDSRFENISGAAVVISNEGNATTQIGFENAVCAKVPVFARFRESGGTQAGPSAIYRIAHLNYGLVLPGAGMIGHID